MADTGLRRLVLWMACLPGVLTLASMLGCSFNVWSTCTTSEDCEAGFVCAAGTCVKPDGGGGGSDGLPDNPDLGKDAGNGVADDLTPEGDAGNPGGDANAGGDAANVGGDANAGGDTGSAGGDPLKPCGDVKFPFSETQETLIVPDNVRYMHVKAWGAGGNEEHPPGDCPGIVDDGGLGGYSEAVFEATPGTPLIVIVGKLGRAGDSTPQERIRFGFGNWGGGGLSGIFLGPAAIDETSQDKALLIAGGGGGSAAICANPGGTGNSEQAGGEATMQGSAGAEGVNGGGGGYHGGSGGARRVPGRGGTGFVRAEAAIDSLLLHSEPGAGMPPNTEDERYDGRAGSYEQNGLILIDFTCEQPIIITPHDQ